jgi:hypothetical protein
MEGGRSDQVTMYSLAIESYEPGSNYILGLDRASLLTNNGTAGRESSTAKFGQRVFQSLTVEIFVAADGQFFRNP